MMEETQQSQQSATDTNTNTSRPLLYTRWNLNSGSLEVGRCFRDTSTPEGKYYSSTLTTPSTLEGESGQKLHLNNTQSRTKELVMGIDVFRRWPITRGRDCLNSNTLPFKVLPLSRYGAYVAPRMSLRSV